MKFCHLPFISDFDCSWSFLNFVGLAEMNLTSFSLSRELIENAFSKKRSRPKIAVESKEAFEKDAVQKCDQCEYKTSKVVYMRDHILVKHSEVHQV